MTPLAETAADPALDPVSALAEDMARLSGDPLSGVLLLRLGEGGANRLLRTRPLAGEGPAGDQGRDSP